jgi:hypothetical protein
MLVEAVAAVGLVARHQDVNVCHSLLQNMASAGRPARPQSHLVVS